MKKQTATAIHEGNRLATFLMYAACVLIAFITLYTFPMRRRRKGRRSRRSGTVWRMRFPGFMQIGRAHV